MTELSEELLSANIMSEGSVCDNMDFAQAIESSAQFQFKMIIATLFITLQVLYNGRQAYETTKFKWAYKKVIFKRK